MYNCIQSYVFASVLVVCFAAGSAAGADGASTVPSSVSAIPDQVFRDALQMYAPNYDYLPRGEQLNAYANIYRVLNNGSQPSLTPGDQQLLGQTRSYMYAPRTRTVPVPPPPGYVGYGAYGAPIRDQWDDPLYAPGGYSGWGGWGW